jgi:hypothetical protein
MNTIEGRLRAAAQAAAGTVAPGSAPPLHLPSEPARRFAVPGPPHRGGWARWAAPLAAAASVVAVVAASLAITSGSGSRARAHAPETAAARAAALASVPPYYVALTGYTGDLTAHWLAVVRATATGTALATVSPPRPYRTFSWVSGAADDRTFVLAAQPWVPGASPVRNANEPTKFFLLHFDPATGAAPLTALPITEKQGYRVIGLALSPDGSKLAVVLATPHEPQQSREIQVFTLATGSQHDWTWAGRGWVGTQDSFGQPLSWAADGRTLAFQQWTGDHLDVRLLDTAAAGSSLRSARPAVAVLSSSNDDSNSLLTPDGRTVIYAPAQGAQENTLPPRFREKLNFAEFSASTGKLVRTLDPWWFSLGSGQLPYQQVLWTNSSGATLIVISPPGASPARHWVRHSIQPVLGVLTGNQFTPIPGSPTASQNITCVAW